MDNYLFMAKLSVNLIFPHAPLDRYFRCVHRRNQERDTTWYENHFLLLCFLLTRYGTNLANAYIAVRVMATYCSTYDEDLPNAANQQLARVANQRLVYYIDYYDALVSAHGSHTIIGEFEIVNKTKKMCFRKTT